MDHTSLGIDFDRIESECARPVVKNEKTAVLNGSARNGNIRDIVDSLVHSGIGIEVISELYTDRFKPVDKILTGKILGSVEAHVLKEVSQTALIILFEDRADLLGDIEVCLTFWIVVVTDKIGKTILECSGAQGRIHRKRRQLAGGLSYRCVCEAEEYRSGGNDS